MERRELQTCPTCGEDFMSDYSSSFCFDCREKRAKEQANAAAAELLLNAKVIGFELVNESINTVSDRFSEIRLQTVSGETLVLSVERWWDEPYICCKEEDD